jgi:hypothetical protein
MVGDKVEGNVFSDEWLEKWINRILWWSSNPGELAKASVQAYNEAMLRFNVARVATDFQRILNNVMWPPFS